MPAEPPSHGSRSACCRSANMSGDLEQEYFSDGISEDIITDLSKVSSLAVVSRNTAFTFKGKNIDLPQVARQLKVNYVLEGSVRRAGGRVRITAQLIEASSDNHLWAERYDRDLNDIFALQDEISEAIVKALKLKLLPEEKKAIEQRGTTNLEAYNLYLMARHHYTNGMLIDTRKIDTVIRLCRACDRTRPELRAGLGADGECAALSACTCQLGRRRTTAMPRRRAPGTRRQPGRGACGDGRRAGHRGRLRRGARGRSADGACGSIRNRSTCCARQAAWLHASAPVPARPLRTTRKPFALRGERHLASGGLLITCYTRSVTRPTCVASAQRTAGARREDRGASMPTTVPPWRRSAQLPVHAGRERSGAGMGPARHADRSGQHDHALQPGLRPGGVPRATSTWRSQLLEPSRSSMGRGQLSG